MTMIVLSLKIIVTKPIIMSLTIIGTVMPSFVMTALVLAPAPVSVRTTGFVGKVWPFLNYYWRGNYNRRDANNDIHTGIRDPKHAPIDNQY